MNLNDNKYDMQLQCWNCMNSFEVWHDISSLQTFISSCQKSIDIRVTVTKCSLCIAEPVKVEKISGKFRKLSPFLILETGHLMNSSSLENMFENTVSITHGDLIVTYKLLGYTLLSNGHFTLKTYIKSEL